MREQIYTQKSLSGIMYPDVITNGVMETGTNVGKIISTAHGASSGDIFFATSGCNQGLSCPIKSVPNADEFILTFSLPFSPTPGDTFQVVRLLYPETGTDGSLLVGAGEGFAQAVNEDDDITATTDMLVAAVKDGSGKAQALAQPLTATELGTAALATSAKQDTIIGHVDGIEGAFTTLNAKDFATQTTLASALTALQTIDNFISGSRGLVTEDNSASIKTAVELIDNCISGSEAQVDVITQPARAATTDTITAKLATDAIQNGTTALTPKFAVIDHAISGDNTLVAAVNPKKIRVLACVLVAAAAVNVRFESGAGGTALSGVMNLAANAGFVLPFNPVGWFETASNTLLNLELSAAVSVDGCLTYVEV